jgi:predicted MFS family arabinose efflux permease
MPRHRETPLGVVAIQSGTNRARRWWPDFIARGLGRGAVTADAFWFRYGLAVACCPALFGRLADRIGTRTALSLLTTIQLTALLLPLLSTGTVALIASSIGGGGTAGGVSALALIRAKELVGDASPRLWRACTASWGAAQATTGFFLAWLFTTSGTHKSIFVTGLVAAAGAFALALVGRSDATD